MLVVSTQRNNNSLFSGPVYYECDMKYGQTRVSNEPAVSRYSSIAPQQKYTLLHTLDWDRLKTKWLSFKTKRRKKNIHGTKWDKKIYHNSYSSECGEVWANKLKIRISRHLYISLRGALIRLSTFFFLALMSYNFIWCKRVPVRHLHVVAQRDTALLYHKSDVSEIYRMWTIKRERLRETRARARHFFLLLYLSILYDGHDIISN